MIFGMALVMGQTFLPALPHDFRGLLFNDDVHYLLRYDDYLYHLLVADVLL